MSRILIVEDSATQREQLETTLSEAGYGVASAPDAAKAFELFRDSDFDLVISDIVMPGESGYELCRRIKADPEKAGVPVMLLSTLNEPMDIIRGLEAGADNFLTKPYRSERLIGRVAAIFENRAIRKVGRVTFGVEVMFLGKKFTINSDKQQILDLLISTFEETVRANQELQRSQLDLASAKAEVDSYARKLEEQVRLSEGKYQLLMKEAKDAIFILDAEGHVLEANDEAEAMLRRARTDVLGVRLDTMLVRDEPSKPAATPFEGLARYRAADGSRMILDTTSSPIEMEGSGLILVIARDVTERIRSETLLQQAQKMEAVGQLTGGMAHDFNNLLTVILGTADLLVEQAGRNQVMRDNAEMVATAAQRGAQLTRQLLAFSRKQTLEPVSVDLNKLVNDLGRLLRRTLGENIEIENVLAGGLWRTLADPAQVESALLNLSLNARDAMPEGGKLTIETANARLDHDYAAAHAEVTTGEYVLLAVSDTGEGMPQEVAARIFEPFFTTKEVGKGTGLGLSQVYGFVKQSGGHIKVYSEPGHGTTVKIYLPRYQETRGVAAQRIDAEKPILRGDEHILVVEDNDLVRNHVVLLVRSFGYRVLEASNADKAMELLQAGARVDLVLTDVMMPGTMNGLQLAAAARKLWPELKMVFTSGYAHTALSNHGKLDSNVLLLSKPFSKGDLARMLRRAFER